VRALATRYREWALVHPGRYAALQRAGNADDPAAADVVGTVFATLRGYGFDETELIHHTRAIRAALHGFVLLEAGGGFAIDLGVDESFERLVAILVAGLAAAGHRRPAA
jgi:hypothetical protein